MNLKQQLFFFLGLLLTLSLQSQSSNGTWEGVARISGQNHKITLTINAIDSTKNMYKYYYKLVTGGMILEREGKKVSFAMRGNVNEDSSVNIRQHNFSKTGDYPCLWELSLGYFKNNILLGQLIGKNKKNDICKTGVPIKLKKILPKA
ncbi:MAG: hypothetical protein Sapg2KO_41790 [Saprospiraceae bacterium]